MCQELREWVNLEPLFIDHYSQGAIVDYFLFARLLILTFSGQIYNCVNASGNAKTVLS